MTTPDFVPDWAKGIVRYQIFPERFWNGDPDGDRALMATENPADPATWVWTAADRLLRSLIAEVHRRGMRIVIDGVFNRMGITSLRNNTPALRRGDFNPVQVDDQREIYAFQRQHGEQTVLVVINRSEQAQPVVLPTGPAGRYLDLINGGEELLVQDGALAVEIPPLWGRVLLAG